jgi:hypothetical protein
MALDSHSVVLYTYHTLKLLKIEPVETYLG